MSIRDNIILHGRFLFFNRDRSRLCKGWRVLVTLVGPLFLVGAATIETGVSVVKKNYPKPVTISRNAILWAMKLISAAEAATRLNVTSSRVRKMIASGRLKATKVGIMWLIDPKDLEAVKDRKVGRPRKMRKTAKKRS
jgi:excisionase family DNA binding protein